MPKYQAEISVRELLEALDLDADALGEESHLTPQSLFDPEEVFELEGGSDATKREWIGNAVPSLAAKAMAEEIGEALLLAKLGATFTLSHKAIWVSPFRMALAVNTDQAAFQLDGRA